MTTEQLERLKQIRQRHHMAAFAYKNQLPPQAVSDIDFLLSLLEQNAATTMRSRCVEKVRAIGAKIQPGEDYTEFHALIVEIIEDLEAITLEQQEKQS